MERFTKTQVRQLHTEMDEVLVGFFKDRGLEFRSGGIKFYPNSMKGNFQVFTVDSDGTAHDPEAADFARYAPQGLRHLKPGTTYRCPDGMLAILRGWNTRNRKNKVIIESVGAPKKRYKVDVYYAANLKEMKQK